MALQKTKAPQQRMRLQTCMIRSCPEVKFSLITEKKMQTCAGEGCMREMERPQEVESGRESASPDGKQAALAFSSEWQFTGYRTR